MSAPLRKIVYSTKPTRRTRRGLLSTVTLECGHMETANAKDRGRGRIYCFDCFYSKPVPHMGRCILEEIEAGQCA